MRGSAFRSATRFFKSEKQRQGRSGLTEAFTCAPEIRFSFSFRARRRGDRERRDTTALGRCPRETEEPLYGSFVHLFDDPSFVSVPLCQFPSPHQRSCNPSLRGGGGGKGGGGRPRAREVHGSSSISSTCYEQGLQCAFERRVGHLPHPPTVIHRGQPVSTRISSPCLSPHLPRLPPNHSFASFSCAFLSVSHAHRRFATPLFLSFPPVSALGTTGETRDSCACPHPASWAQPTSSKSVNRLVSTFPVVSQCRSEAGCRSEVAT